jgi:hypothetical protein
MRIKGYSIKFFSYTKITRTRFNIITLFFSFYEFSWFRFICEGRRKSECLSFFKNILRYDIESKSLRLFTPGNIRGIIQKKIKTRVRPERPGIPKMPKKAH